ncbi:MAG: polysaccharide biosynthesis/export family protein, partial [Pseudomonadales bacterium]
MSHFFSRIRAPRIHAPRFHAPRFHAPRFHAQRFHAQRFHAAKTSAFAVAGILMLCAATLLSGGCATNPGAPIDGSMVSPSAADSSTNYIIGPGDTLNIFVWRNPDVSGEVPVRPDGKITTP